MSLLLVVYALAVGTLLTAAAALADAGLRGANRPSRAVWIVAIAVTATAPLWGPRLAAPAPETVVTLTATEVGYAPTPAAVENATLWSRAMAAWDGATARVTAASEAAWSRLGPALVAPRPALGWLWLGFGTLGIGVVGIGLWRLERRASRLPRAMVDGEEVSVSRDFGPALVGVRRPRTVVPHWVLSMARREIELILAHERTHRAAGDGFVLALGLLAVAVCPWNPLVWCQFRRLRDAVEMDCDRRLLEGGVSLPAYARVLVLVRLRAAEVGGGAVALVDSGSSLERRLRTMRGFTWTRRRVALTGLAALGVTVVACETPAPGVVEVEVEGPAEAEIVTLHEEEVPVSVVTVRGERIDADEVEEPTVIVSDRQDSYEARRAKRPLVFVDGEVLEGGDISELVPDDIERIEIVKGAAARELYGERGANGVVQVFTKDGKREIVEGALQSVEGVIRDAAGAVEGGLNVPAGEFRLRQLRPDESSTGGESAAYYYRELPTDASSGVTKRPFIVESIEFGDERDGGVLDRDMLNGDVARGDVVVEGRRTPLTRAKYNEVCIVGTPGCGS